MQTDIDIDYVARLARIALTPEEKAKFGAQLGQVLEHFQKLEAIDVDGVEPMAHAFDVVNVLDADEPTEPFTPEQALRNAPARRDNQIVVPKVVDDA
ncbi:MAG: Asp-tRNA(Asn)/Glu-tRNA(Gln) amidotransferase subunit GatC [Opitutales bacterium]